MTKYRDHKSNNNFSRFTALSMCSWILIALIIFISFFYDHFELNFKTKFTTINSYLVIFQQRNTIFYGVSAFIALFLVTIILRILSFKTYIIFKFPLLLIPIVFLTSLIWLKFNLYLLILELNIPVNDGIFALKRYIQNFSINLILHSLTTLPNQLNSIKIPLYGVIYSYLAMFSLIIFIPLCINFKTSSLWQRLNVFLSLLFVIVFILSVYYLIINFVMHDPFKPYEQMMESLSYP